MPAHREVGIRHPVPFSRGHMRGAKVWLGTRDGGSREGREANIDDKNDDDGDDDDADDDDGDGDDGDGDDGDGDDGDGDDDDGDGDDDGGDDDARCRISRKRDWLSAHLPLVLADALQRLEEALGLRLLALPPAGTGATQVEQAVLVSKLVVQRLLHELHNVLEGQSRVDGAGS